MRRLTLETTHYSIDPFDAYGERGRRGDSYDAAVTIAGLGGTGAFLAEDLARLFSIHAGWRVRLHLVDHDRVEQHNEQRQAFSRRDRGQYKAQVVAERLVRQFPIEASFSVTPYDHQLDAPNLDRFGHRARLALLVGCVDNAAARTELASTLVRPAYGSPTLWYIDLGNAAASGQLYIGNTLRSDDLRQAFDPETHVCRVLPAPTLQAPELLEAPTMPMHASEVDCAEAAITGGQAPYINRAIAALGLAMVARLCERKLTWRAVYFDLEVGMLRYIPIEVQDIAQLVGLRPSALLRNEPRRRRGRVA
jgi:molybdopterin/thiamine biosynthesis adenylyltransferase